MSNLEWVEMSNGKFPRCPHCRKLMAQACGGQGPRYVCLIGCGLIYEPRKAPAYDIERFETWQADFWKEIETI